MILTDIAVEVSYNPMSL